MHWIQAPVARGEQHYGVLENPLSKDRFVSGTKEPFFFSGQDGSTFPAAEIPYFRDR
jgi:hypothetical protein